MKTLFVFLIAITSMATTAVTDKDGYTMEFAQTEKDVLAQFDLLGEAYKGKVFMITYTTDTEEDEEGDEISINIIVGMKLAE